MHNQEAARIIDALCRGVDPTSGEAIEEGILREPDIIRALYLALRSLEAVPTGSLKTEGPARAGQPWDRDEDRRLADEFKAGKTPSDLAKQHQRTRGAVDSRLTRLGLVEPSRADGPLKTKLEPRRIDGA